LPEKPNSSLPWNSLQIVALLQPWVNMTASADISIEKQNCIKEAYAENVATIIQAVGFAAPVKFINQPIP
jgi:soluble lytic murein transglycosylase-like protein